MTTFALLNFVKSHIKCRIFPNIHVINTILYEHETPQFHYEVIAPEIQQVVFDVHFQTTSLKVWSSGTKCCVVGAPVVQVVSGAATRAEKSSLNCRICMRH
jgi:hypothetical protein